MNELIFAAIEECEKKIKENNQLILTESDFERLLVNEIEKKLEERKKEQESEYVVHTQISYYDPNSPSPRYRVDILLMEKDKINYGNIEHRKSFVYSANAYAIEVKYLHKDDPVSLVNRDFSKVESLLNANTTLFVVVLLEEEGKDLSKRNKIFDYETKYKSMFEKELKKYYNNNKRKGLFCRVISKTPKSITPEQL